MRSALFNGTLGAALAWFVGTKILDLTLADVGLCLIAAQVAGLLALFVTLQTAKVPFLRKNVVNRSLKTWALLLLVFFGTVVLLAPPTRELRNGLWMTIPLVLSTGFCIVLFGPIQDFLVRREQRRAANSK
jgi:putative effector of murein hydrolase LrgA (UPF0299 family)